MTELRRAAEEYLAVRRRLGYKLERAGRLLPEFVEFVENAGASRITTELSLAWAQQPPDGHPAWWAERLSVVRGFARHLHGLDPSTEVPPPGVFNPPARRATPYLYSPADVGRLMAAARALPSPLRAATYETLVGLLAVTGMRVGEAIRLDRGDVDWDKGLLVVHASKFAKSRHIPLHPSTVEALADYERLRDRLCPTRSAGSLFVSLAGTRLIYNNVHATFLALVRAAGLTGSSPSRRPRPHDLRHSFAVATLIGWYRDGGDVPARLPLLSTYLGHFDPSSTYWYLQAVPELLSLAAERLEPQPGEEQP